MPVIPAIFHVGATATCPHGGKVSTISTNTRVLVNGLQVATATDTFVVTGCVYNLNGAPHPCVTVKFLVPAARVKVMGQPVILKTSASLVKAADQAPQGPASIVTVQPRVKGL
jgi:uncharacterized Zn-binding protein involved in type VI secretion